MKQASLINTQHVIELANGQRFEEALAVCRQVCRQHPGDAEAWFLLGAINGQLGEFAEAETACREALQLQPEHAMLHYNLAIALLNQDKLDEAIVHFGEAIRIQPQYADAYHDLGNALQAQGKLDQAIHNYQQAIRLQPALAPAHYNLGNAYRDQDRLDEATASYQRALELKPDFIQACSELAAIHIHHFQYDKAVELLEPAIGHAPDIADLHFKLAVARQEQGETDAAIQAYQHALELDPGKIEANYGIGRCLRKQGNITDAIKRFESVLAGKPDYAEVLAVLGGARKDQGRINDALAAFRKAIKIQPDRADFHSSYLFNMNYTDSVTRTEQYSKHCRWGKLFGNACGNDMRPDNSPDADRRLRIGYVSPDFRTHSVAYFFEPLLNRHDRNAFECFCYSDMRMHRADMTTSRLMQHADHWRDITSLSDTQAANMVHADRIDILVDLAGHTGGNRLGIFACKPAPIQVCYIGYPNTTGLPGMDYKIVDDLTDPEPEADQYYTESLIRLPQGFLCYLPPGEAPEPAPPPVLSSGHITFGSFNNLAKVTPDVVKTWAGLMQSVPDSRLIMKNSSFRDAPTSEYYYSMFHKAGADRERIILMPGTASLEEHLASYGTVDIALDTFPYNGTTTTCEALWMGVPVVALKGSTHAGRVGYSLLAQVGLSSLVSLSRDEYISIATGLASATDELSRLRRNLRDMLMSSSLCNAQSIHRIENFYRTAWRKWCYHTNNC